MHYLLLLWHVIELLHQFFLPVRKICFFLRFQGRHAINVGIVILLLGVSEENWVAFRAIKISMSLPSLSLSNVLLHALLKTPRCVASCHWALEPVWEVSRLHREIFRMLTICIWFIFLQNVWMMQIGGIDWFHENPNLWGRWHRCYFRLEIFWSDKLALRIPKFAFVKGVLWWRLSALINWFYWFVIVFQ
jgi:hypothetical protein